MVRPGNLSRDGALALQRAQEVENALAFLIRQNLGVSVDHRIGVGQRMFFLHDGRTSDLKAAILAHRSPTDSIGSDKFKPSEANAVIDRYTQVLTDQDRQGILDFLRAL